MTHRTLICSSMLSRIPLFSPQPLETVCTVVAWSPEFLLVIPKPSFVRQPPSTTLSSQSQRLPRPSSISTAPCSTLAPFLSLLFHQSLPSFLAMQRSFIFLSAIEGVSVRFLSHSTISSLPRCPPETPRPSLCLQAFFFYPLPSKFLCSLEGRLPSPFSYSTAVS